MKLVTRRQFVPWLGGALLGGALFVRRAAACTLAPSLTQGPFWVDEKLERSDIAADPKGRIAGVPLTLHVAVAAFSDSSCRPLRGAQVDVWHCDAQGAYSDADNMGQSDTHGRTYLRGFQKTDAHGRVTFETIVPGWYFGRTVHIHVKVRRFAQDRALLTEATTQLFFDDALTESIFAAHPAYRREAKRDRYNAQDEIYGGHRTLLCKLDGDTKRGYEAHASLAVEDGVIMEEQMPPPGMGPPPGMFRPPFAK